MERVAKERESRVYLVMTRSRISGMSNRMLSMRRILRLRAIILKSTSALKVGILDGAILGPEKLKAIADIPSREAVLSQLLATILEPSTRIARVIQKKFNPDADSKKDEAPAEEAAPAAEAAAEPAAEA
jgi:hypothetical protein